jgi:hypothetical protein
VCRRGELPARLGEYPPDIDASVGDYHDVMCVASNLKPLAAFDHTSYGKRLIRKDPTKDLPRIRSIVAYAIAAGVQIMTVKVKSNNYMKSVAFKPKERTNALKLLLLLHTKNYPVGTKSATDVVYFVGKLLGYNVENIQNYIKTNLRETFTKDDVRRCNRLLKSYNVFERSFSNFFIVENLSTFKP